MWGRVVAKRDHRTIIFDVVELADHTPNCDLAHSLIDHNSSGRQPLGPYVWAGFAANHYRPEPEPSAETVTRTGAATSAGDPLPQAKADARDDRG